MADFNPPFANSGSKRPPNSTEITNGFPCGALDRDLFNWLFYSTQAEINAVIVDAGIEPSNSSYNQLLQALKRIVGRGRRVQVFQANGTFTVPADSSSITVTVVGGGGGGGYADNTGFSGGGGGAGGFAQGPIAVTPGQTFNVIVGQGGIGGSAGAGSGQDGGTTSFGNAMSATGGKGGLGNVGYASGGEGGEGVGGLLNFKGSWGTDGRHGTTSYPGDGGSGPWGGSGRGAAANGTKAPNGAAPGAGGGGCYGSPSPAMVGGDGADGIVIVEY